MIIKWRQCYLKLKKISIGFMVFIGLALFIKFGHWAFNAAIPVSTPPAGHSNSIDKFLPLWRSVFNIDSIQNKTGKESQGKITIKPQTSVMDMLRGPILLLTGLDIRDMRSLLRAEIPLLSLVRPNMPTINTIRVPNFPKFDSGLALVNGKPLVGIYHTHTSESFVPDSGTTHKRGGQQGDIVDIGGALANRLEKYGIRSVHSKDIHDYPSFMKAYGPSEITAKKMLADNPSIQMIFDIHRDAEKRENAVTMVNGSEVARIGIVVATGREDFPQPHWQQNYAFAKLLDAKLNQYFPGLSRGIQLVDWRYNQHLHPGALLLEVGSHESTKQEAIKSIEFFGDILAEIITENNKNNSDTN